MKKCANFRSGEILRACAYNEKQPAHLLHKLLLSYPDVYSIMTRRGTRSGCLSVSDSVWSRRVLPPRFRFPEGHPDTLSTPKLLYQKPQKSGLRLHRLIRIISILDVPTLAFVVHVRNLIHFLQSRLLTLRANCNRVIGVMLKYLGLLQAIVAMINVDGQVRPPFYKRWQACRCAFVPYER